LPFQKASFLYKNALNDKNLKKFLQVPIDIATEIICNSHANAVAIEGIQGLIQSLRKEYIVVILSDADNDFLISALKKNNIIVDMIVTSEMAKGYKRNVNSNVFNHFLSQYNYSPDSIIHIGDSINDKIGCEKYGIKFLYFNPFNRPSCINNINTVNSLSEIYDLFLE
jgi:HAD superfamily hydrolase (TIGR01549 family)